MQEQSFEDDVRRKMEELSFAPSAPVWLEVEAQIRRKDKRRRVLLFWLLPLILLGGFLTYRLTTTGGELAVQHPLSAEAAPKPHTQVIENKTGFLVKQQQKESSLEEPIISYTAQPIPSTGLNKKKSNSGSIQTVVAKQITNKTKASYFSSAETGAVKNATAKPEVPISNESSSDISVKANEAINSISLPIASFDTTAKSTTTTTVTDLALTDSTAAIAKPSTPTPKKWNWSLQVNGGISNLKQNLFSENAPLEMSGPLTSTPQNSASGGSNTLRRGVAFSVGATADRDLTKKIKFTAGLQYAYFSTRLRVGQKVARDTSITTGGFSNTTQDVNGYYTPGNRQDYTNKYHFVQMPIGIEWKVSNAIPLSLNFGASISHLFATNHLERTATGTIYYKSDDKLAKTGVHLFSGANYRIWHSTKYAVHIGPYIQYGLTPLQKEPAKRAVFTGIQTKFSF